MARAPVPPSLHGRRIQKPQFEMNHHIIIDHEEKKDAWTKVTELYNEDAQKRGIAFERSTKQLVRSYNYIKSKVRDQDSDVKRHKPAGTGGGPPLLEETGQIDELVRGIKPHIDFTLENQFNSTSQFEDDFASSNVEDYAIGNETDLPFPTHDNHDEINNDGLDMHQPTIDIDPTKIYAQNPSDASEGEFFVITSDEELESQYRAMKNFEQQKLGLELDPSQHGEQIDSQQDVGNEQPKLGYSSESSDSPSPKSVPKRSTSATISSQEEEERVQKLKEARDQQYKIHRKRMELLEKGKELLDTRIQVIQLERDVKILERQAAELELQIMSHEVDPNAEG
ncbi:hypothetical protein QAD02_007646 [Eretmocerus hayati]|uniref:Uncharacterized protein n=1 Tax=Eretmocerus hayati TaxID=131215 RepID=A0ACC2N4M8_9HYME|nr:hypothetical protein QAD02_007646 [Eretmocerus hayati]